MLSLTIKPFTRYCCRCKEHRPLKGGKVSQAKFICEGCVAERSKVEPVPIAAAVR